MLTLEPPRDVTSAAADALSCAFARDWRSASSMTTCRVAASHQLRWERIWRRSALSSSSWKRVSRV